MGIFDAIASGLVSIESLVAHAVVAVTGASGTAAERAVEVTWGGMEIMIGRGLDASGLPLGTELFVQGAEHLLHAVNSPDDDSLAPVTELVVVNLQTQRAEADNAFQEGDRTSIEQQQREQDLAPLLRDATPTAPTEASPDAAAAVATMDAAASNAAPGGGAGAGEAAAGASGVGAGTGAGGGPQ